MKKNVMAILMALAGSVSLAEEPAKSLEEYMKRPLEQRLEELPDMPPDELPNKFFYDGLKKGDYDTSARELMTSVKPPDDNAYRLDLEGLLNQEQDGASTITADVIVYTGNMDSQLVRRGVQMTQNFFLSGFGVNLKVTYRDAVFPIGGPLRKNDGEFTVVFCEDDEYGKLLSETERQFPEIRNCLGKDDNIGYAVGLAFPQWRGLLIRNNAVRDRAIYEVTTEKLIGQAVSHELGHLCGLWHPGVYTSELEPWNFFEMDNPLMSLEDNSYVDLMEKLVPLREISYLTDAKIEHPNMMGLFGMRLNYKSAKMLGLSVSDFQRSQTRSFLRGGVAYREFKEDGFDLSRFMARVIRYSMYKAYRHK